MFDIFELHAVLYLIGSLIDESRRFWLKDDPAKRVKESRLEAVQNNPLRIFRIRFRHLQVLTASATTSS